MSRWWVKNNHSVLWNTCWKSACSVQRNTEFCLQRAFKEPSHSLLLYSRNPLWRRGGVSRCTRRLQLARLTNPIFRSLPPPHLQLSLLHWRPGLTPCSCVPQVPGSPPHMPRLGHDGRHAAAQDGPPSRLAKLRQVSLVLLPAFDLSSFFLLPSVML